MEPVSQWSAQQVVQWMRGLDPSLQAYVPAFQQQEVRGERLLRLTPQELLSLGLSRLGHQELLLEAVELLGALKWDVQWDQLSASVGQMRAALVRLQVSALERRRNPSYRGVRAQQPSNLFLTAVVELIASAKTLLGGLDRTPTTGMRELSSTKNTIIQLCLQLTSTVQKDCTVYEMEDKIMEVARALLAVCEQTAAAAAAAAAVAGSCLEEVCISNLKPGEGLGMYIKSTYNGLHVITGTLENSPADRTGLIHAGDEVVQVNGQTVVGWQLTHLVASLKASPRGVVLVLKKRPSGVSSSFTPAPLKNLRWRPPLVQVSGLRCSEGGVEDQVSPAVQEFYIPPPPSRPYSPRGGSADTPARPKSPNSSLDVGGGRGLSPLGPAPNGLPLPTPVRLRQRSTRGVSSGKPRPISMPAVPSDPLGRAGLYGRTAQDALQRCLSNERIAPLWEEGAPRPPRGVDRIRGSHCLLDPRLLGAGATLPYRGGPGSKPCPPAVSTVTAPPSSSYSSSGAKRGPSSSSAPGHSLLGGWLARLRLLSH